LRASPQGSGRFAVIEEHVGTVGFHFMQDISVTIDTEHSTIPKGLFKKLSTNKQRHSAAASKLE
jgi:hypothetical protein